MNLIGYARVSTEEQARGGVSLGDQRSRLGHYAAGMGHELLDIVSDEGLSGRISPDKRPGLASALTKVRAKKVDGLVVWSIDRLSRNVLEILHLAEEAQKRGWHLLSVNDHIDTSTAVGRFALGILALLAELESSKTGERISLGMERLVQLRRVTSYYTPFGWRMPDGTTHPRKRDRDQDGNRTGDRDTRQLVPHAEELALLDDMMAAANAGQSPRQLCKQLKATGVLNPRTGKPFREVTVTSILKTARKYSAILKETG